MLKGVSNQSSTSKSILNALFPDHNKGKDVYYQGSRQMTSTSRRYFEKELGTGMGPAPGFSEMFGYSEPLRRFIQREGFEPQANEITNTMSARYAHLSPDAAIASAERIVSATTAKSNSH